MFFDTHTHANFNAFKNDSQEVIERALKNNVWLVNVGSQASTSKRAVKMAQNYQEGVYAAVGLHPSHLEDESFDEKFYLELAKNVKVVAIGECGLDYFRSPSEAEITKQKEIFIKQIELARELNKPLILHCRPSIGIQDAYEDAIGIIENCKWKIKNCENGVAHFFSGSKEIAQKFLDLGFYISFAGPITFAPEYKKIVEFIPINKILIETDAPFAAPTPHRGRRNEPAYVEFVARQIAEWKNLNFEKIAEQTIRNAIKLFNIKNLNPR